MKALCHACNESQWCTRWYLTGKDGRTTPCSSTTIDDLDIAFDDLPPLRSAEQSNLDDVRDDLRQVMKVHPETLNILFDDDQCFKCKGSGWEIAAWCDCGRPVCADCDESELGIPTLCGMGRCSLRRFGVLHLSNG